mmetsp:Transcript_31001/g.66004  ORF Transcript_31001/g.66004 Transcript_31001/m.66004 type:complete len:82 (+) Transcript_31001:1073-1318(+)
MWIKCTARSSKSDRKQYEVAAVLFQAMSSVPSRNIWIAEHTTVVNGNTTNARRRSCRTQECTNMVQKDILFKMPSFLVELL